MVGERGQRCFIKIPDVAAIAPAGALSVEDDFRRVAAHVALVDDGLRCGTGQMRGHLKF